MGISLATGLLITVLSIKSSFDFIDHIGTPIYSPVTGEQRYLKVGEILLMLLKLPI